VNGTAQSYGTPGSIKTTSIHLTSDEQRQEDDEDLDG
jgi:hypothetical protein